MVLTTILLRSYFVVPQLPSWNPPHKAIAAPLTLWSKGHTHTSKETATSPVRQKTAQLSTGDTVETTQIGASSDAVAHEVLDRQHPLDVSLPARQGLDFGKYRPKTLCQENVSHQLIHVHHEGQGHSVQDNVRQVDCLRKINAPNNSQPAHDQKPWKDEKDQRHDSLEWPHAKYLNVAIWIPDQELITVGEAWKMYHSHGLFHTTSVLDHDGEHPQDNGQRAEDVASLGLSNSLVAWGLAGVTWGKYENIKALHKHEYAFSGTWNRHVQIGVHQLELLLFERP